MGKHSSPKYGYYNYLAIALVVLGVVVLVFVLYGI